MLPFRDPALITEAECADAVSRIIGDTMEEERLSEDGR
jgi:hypothetical protein